jgi:conjugative transposon TraM protein
MEKSYEMAAKYLPVGAKATDSVKSTAESGSDKGVFEAIHSERKDVVSALYRKPTDSAFVANWSQQRNRGFYTSNSSRKATQPGNSIRACVHETQTVTSEGSVVLRLLETGRISDRIIPAGTHLIAFAKFQTGRLQLQVVSMELEGSIIPLDVHVYDLDGQKGLHVPYSPEMNAATEMASKMGTATGTSFTLNSSAEQQVAADLSKGVIQGVTGYFAKKVKTPKVTVKAGYQLFLVSKK